ncbi:MAG: YegP family protein [Chloroflexi bacterium]|nr:YegP family protein [Chloroflexota bacterium]
MPAQYKLRKSSNGQFYFSLTAENNEPILASEMYKSKDGALKGIESVRVNSPEDSRYVRNTSSDGKYYFVLRAANNEPIGRSEMYSSKQGMENGIQAVKRVGPNAPVSDETS